MEIREPRMHSPLCSGLAWVRSPFSVSLVHLTLAWKQAPLDKFREGDHLDK